MAGEPVTTNPLLIMMINMMIVFGVLFLLEYVIRVIYWIDPTRKKEKRQVQEEKKSAEKIAAILATQERIKTEEKTLIAVITTAIMAYGYQDVKVKSIRKISNAK